jgi:hypothetical protein
MTVPKIYAAISAVTAELAGTGIAKAHVNLQEQYAYRSIDDVMKRLAPALARHRVCILPRVLARESCERAGPGETLLVSVTLKVAFDFVSARDGSSHTVEAIGEALDGGDKGTSKAMSAAYKQAVLQAFCIPVEAAEDADAATARMKVSTEQPDPDQGWEQWSLDIQDMIRVCETEEALDRIQNTYRALLRAASKRRRDLYEAIGAAMQARRASVGRRGRAAPSLAETPVRIGNAAGDRAEMEAAHA